MKRATKVMSPVTREVYMKHLPVNNESEWTTNNTQFSVQLSDISSINKQDRSISIPSTWLFVSHKLGNRIQAHDYTIWGERTNYLRIPIGVYRLFAPDAFRAWGSGFGGTCGGVVVFRRGCAGFICCSKGLPFPRVARGSSLQEQKKLWLWWLKLSDQPAFSIY